MDKAMWLLTLVLAIWIVGCERETAPAPQAPATVDAVEAKVL